MIIFVGKNGTNAINLYENGFKIEEIFTSREDSYAFSYFKGKVKVSMVEDLSVQLSQYQYNLIFLAGYLKKIPKEIVEQYSIINLHPSLLPSFKGLNALEKSYLAGYGTGITIHKVNENIDEGEILFQKSIDPSSLSLTEYKSLLKETEHKIVPSLIYDLFEEYSLN